MIEMPNSQMIEEINSNSVIMNESVQQMMTTISSEIVQQTNLSLDKDMIFNDGHKLSIIGYSILMVISAIGNTTVLTILLKRRKRTSSKLDVMLTHLAIADLMVS
jgi:hypothetical protein